MTNYEFEFRMSFDSIDIFEDSTRERILKKKKVDMTKKMKKIMNFIKEKLVITQSN
jgi:hypothetical protein